MCVGEIWSNLAQNCRLQVQQVSVKESNGDTLILTLGTLCFLTDSITFIV